MTRAEAILEAVVEKQTDDDEGRVIIHRDVPGEHYALDEACWCCPHIFRIAPGEPTPSILGLLAQVDAAERLN